MLDHDSMTPSCTQHRCMRDACNLHDPLPTPPVAVMILAHYIMMPWHAATCLGIMTAAQNPPHPDPTSPRATHRSAQH